MKSKFQRCLALCIFFVSGAVYAQVPPPPGVEILSSGVKVQQATKLNFSGATVTPAGNGQVDITVSAAVTPSSPDTSIQFNNGGAFGGSANLVWDGAQFGVTGTASILDVQSNVVVSGSVGGASATHNVVIGPGAAGDDFTTNAVIIGKDATGSNGDFSYVVIGDTAHIDADFGIAIGKDATVSGVGSIHGVAVGHGAITSGPYGFAGGYNTQAGDSAVGIGRENNATGQYAVSIGYSAIGTANSSIQIGAFTSAGTDCINIGSGGYASGSGAIAIGSGNSVALGGAIVIGFGTFGSNANTVIGVGANDNGNAYSTIIGKGAFSVNGGGGASTVIGESASGASDSFAGGNAATAASSAVAVGASSNAAVQSIALGFGTVSNSSQFVAGSGSNPITDAYFGSGNDLVTLGNVHANIADANTIGFAGGTASFNASGNNIAVTANSILANSSALYINYVQTGVIDGGSLLWLQANGQTVSWDGGGFVVPGYVAVNGGTIQGDGFGDLTLGLNVGVQAALGVGAQLFMNANQPISFSDGPIIQSDGGSNIAISNAGGSITLESSGNVHITGKLTLDGILDPPGVRISSGGQDVWFEATDGQSASVSASNEGRIRYNSNIQQWEASVNGGSYATLGGAAAGPDTSVQFNSGGALTGSSNLTFDGTNLSLGGNLNMPEGYQLRWPISNVGFFGSGGAIEFDFGTTAALIVGPSGGGVSLAFGGDAIIDSPGALNLNGPTSITLTTPQVTLSIGGTGLSFTDSGTGPLLASVGGDPIHFDTNTMALDGAAQLLWNDGPYISTDNAGNFNIISNGGTIQLQGNLNSNGANATNFYQYAFTDGASFTSDGGSGIRVFGNLNWVDNGFINSDGGSGMSLGTGGGPFTISASHIDNSGTQIKNMADGTVAQDAVTLSQMNAAITAAVLGGGVSGGVLNDGSSVKSEDWYNRQLFDTSGTSISIDWGARQFVTGGNIVYDWSSGTLYANGVGPAILLNSFMLRDPNALTNSLDWGARKLYRSSGVEVLNYSGGIGFFGASPVGQQTGGAATAGAVYTSAEQGMINRMYTAMRALGLLN